MNQPKKRNQHFVPQYYFKFFNSGNKFISILLVNKNKFIPNGGVSDQSSLSYFYGDSKVEDHICEIENANRKALIDFFNNQKICNNKHRKLLIDAILFQEGRTEKKRMLSLNAWKSAEALRKIDNDQPANLNEAGIWIKDNPLMGFEVDQKNWHLRQLKMIKNSNWQLDDLSILVVKNISNSPFIFSDAPVVYLNPFMSKFKDRGVIGSLSKGLIVVYPLNNEWLIVLYEKAVYHLKHEFNKDIDSNGYFLANEEITNYFNILQFLNAESCVYSGDMDYLPKLLNTPGRVESNFECSVKLVESSDKKGVQFSGALNQFPDFPSPPMFNHKFAKNFTPARPAPQKKYKKLQEKRNDLINDPEKLMNLVKNCTDQEEIFDKLLLG